LDCPGDPGSIPGETFLLIPMVALLFAVVGVVVFLEIWRNLILHSGGWKRGKAENFGAQLSRCVDYVCLGTLLVEVVWATTIHTVDDTHFTLIKAVDRRYLFNTR
jgi:hypothetical protein